MAETNSILSDRNYDAHEWPGGSEGLTLHLVRWYSRMRAFPKTDLFPHRHTN